MKMLTKISKQEKRFLLAGALTLMVYVAYVYVIEPAVVSQAEVRKQIQTKRDMLERFRPPSPGREYYQARLQDLVSRSREAQALLLKQTKAPLAAATLQGLLHQFGRESGLTLLRENVMQPKTRELFGEVAVELSVRGDMRAFRDFLYRVQTAPHLLTLSKLTVRRGAANIESAVMVDLQVVGYLQKEESHTGEISKPN